MDGQHLGLGIPSPRVTVGCAVDVGWRPCLARLGQEAGWVALLAVGGDRARDLGTCLPGADGHLPAEL